MDRLSRSSFHPNPIAAAIELPAGLLLGLIYAVLTTFIVIEWVGATAAFNELVPMTLEDYGR